MSPVDLLIKNGTIVTSDGRYKANIVIEGEKIALITKQEPKAEKVVNASERLVLPGIMDPHSHIRDPGFTQKEDFETGTKAAAAGGITFVCPQPNLKPVPNTVENFMKEVEIGEKKSLVDFNPPASPLRYKEGHVQKLAEAGTAWFKIFQKVGEYPYNTEAGTLNTAHIYRAFKAVAKTGLYCSVHPYNHDILQEINRDLEREDKVTWSEEYFGRIWTPEEYASAAYMLYYFAKKAGVRWYALHAGVADYIELVRLAKAEKKIDVISSVEAGPFIFSRKMNPEVLASLPLYWKYVGKPEEGKACWDGIRDGTIDMLGTDHAPHLPSEIIVEDPRKANLGYPIFEWYLSLVLTEVNNGTISLEKMVEICSENCAKIFHFYPRKGAIQKGSDADITIVDLNKEYSISDDRIYTKCGFNPFVGVKVKGKPTHTIVRGTIVMENGEVIGKAGHGKFIRPLVHNIEVL